MAFTITCKQFLATFLDVLVHRIDMPEGNKRQDEKHQAQ